MDIRLKNEYCTVTGEKGEVIVAQFFKNARIETNYSLQHSTKIANIDVKKALAMPEDGVVEKNMLYAKEGEVVCPKESGDVTKIGLIDVSTKLIKIG